MDVFYTEVCDSATMPTAAVPQLTEADFELGTSSAKSSRLKSWALTRLAIVVTNTMLRVRLTLPTGGRYGLRHQPCVRSRPPLPSQQRSNTANAYLDAFTSSTRGWFAANPQAPRSAAPIMPPSGMRR